MKPTKQLVGFLLYVPLDVLCMVLIAASNWTAGACFRLADWVDR